MGPGRARSTINVPANWSAGITAAGTDVSGGIGFLAVQVSEARRARGMSEVAACNDARAGMDAAALRVEAHVSSPTWPPLGDSPTRGAPQPCQGGTEWQFPEPQDHRLLLQAEPVVINRSERTVRATNEGDLWEIDVPGDRPRQMVQEMLLCHIKVTPAATAPHPRVTPDELSHQLFRWSGTCVVFSADTTATPRVPRVHGN